VHLEASDLPDITEVPPEFIETLQVSERNVFHAPCQIKLPDQGTTPSSTWKSMVLSDFIETRMYLTRWLDRKIQSKFGRTPPKKSDQEAWTLLRSNEPPLVHLLLSMDQKICNRVMKDMLYQLIEKCEANPEYIIPPDWSLWFYSILARFEKPLPVGIEANLRSLLRTICSIRSVITTDRLLTEPLKTALSGIDILVCVLTEYFKV